MIVFSTARTHRNPGQVLNCAVADLRALERYILEVVEVQQHEPSLQAHHDAARLVHHMIELLRAHVGRLDVHLAGLRHRAPEETGDVSRSVAGVFVGFICKMRSHEASHLLRDDYTLLSLAMMGYTILHTTGLALDDRETAGIALEHLRELTVLSREIGLSMPGVVVDELSVGLDLPNRTADKCALANLQGLHTHGRYRRDPPALRSCNSQSAMPSLAKA